MRSESQKVDQAYGSLLEYIFLSSGLGEFETGLFSNRLKYKVNKNLVKDLTCSLLQVAQFSKHPLF